MFFIGGRGFFMYFFFLLSRFLLMGMGVGGGALLALLEVLGDWGVIIAFSFF